MAKPLDVDKLLQRFPFRFEPEPFYSEDSDSFQFYHENVDHYAERVDCWLTVYREFNSEKLVGFKIKNVRTLLSRFDSLGLSYAIPESRKGYQILLQPVLAFIPVAFKTTSNEQRGQYSDVLTSFAGRLNRPIDLVHT